MNPDVVSTDIFLEELEQWRLGVPQHLSQLLQPEALIRWEPFDFDQSCIVLAFRFSMVRMLAYRPVISQALEVSRRKVGTDGTYTPSIAYRACLEGLAACTHDATKVIAIGSALAKNSIWLRGGSAWYRLYYRTDSDKLSRGARR